MAKKKKSTKIISLPQSPETKIRSRARNLEIGQCFINSNWEEAREAHIMISRNHKQGGITYGIYLIDLEMKGLIDTHYEFNMSPVAFRDLLNEFADSLKYKKADYNLLHNIIYGAIEFGEENEHSPHKDFSVSQYILEEDTDDIPLMEIEFGFEGEPMLFDNQMGDEFDLDDDEFDEFDNFWPTTEEEFIELVCELPDIAEQDITQGWNEELLEAASDEWKKEDWTNYFKQNSGNYSYRLLAFAVSMALIQLFDYADFDHFEYIIGSKLKKSERKDKELDKMNQEASALLNAGEYDRIPGAYHHQYIFQDLFPKAKVYHENEVAEFCRIYCEFFLYNDDIEEAYRYFDVLELLSYENPSEEIKNTFRKITIMMIDQIRKVANPVSDKIDLKIWKEFYKLCDKIYALKPWEKLYETDIFGIKFPGEEREVFVSIMGSNREVFALAAYEGTKALAQFWDMQDENKATTPEDMFTTPHSMISWDKPDNVVQDQMAIMKSLKLSYYDFPSWPQIVKMKPGFVPHTPDINQIQDSIIILTQSLHVIKRALKDPNLIENDSMEDSEFLYRIPKYTGSVLSWHDEYQILLPQLYDHKLFVVPAELESYLKLPIGWDTIQLNFEFMPFPIKNKNGPDTFTFILIFVNPVGGEIISFAIRQPLPDYESLLTKLADIYLNKCLGLGMRPKKIEMKNPDMVILRDFLEEKTDTSVTFRKHLPETDKALESLIENLQPR
ncbi:MAG: hypothetical protein U9N86_11350 [Bacteroidota bacterium]|nr:hypothetical protein [Bacteroidota bacterium]